MTEQRTFRELIRFVRHPPKSIESMRNYIERLFHGVGIMWLLIGGALVVSLQQRNYPGAIIIIFLMFPLLVIAVRILSTSVAEELERVVKEGEWP